MILFYDFETNGLPLFNEPSEDPRQPHIVQAAAKLVIPESRRCVASLNYIARPDGWTIPEEVTEVHGISTDTATSVGVDERYIVDALIVLWNMAEFRVAHNETFDARIMRIALKRFVGPVFADTWKGGKSECTALLSTPICKLPPTERMMASGRRSFKKPRLEEAYEHFTGAKMENAHQALADVDACETIYFTIKQGEQQSV